MKTARWHACDKHTGISVECFQCYLTSCYNMHVRNTQASVLNVSYVTSLQVLACEDSKKTCT